MRHCLAFAKNNLSNCKLGYAVRSQGSAETSGLVYRSAVCSNGYDVPFFRLIICRSVAGAGPLLASHTDCDSFVNSDVLRSRIPLERESVPVLLLQEGRGHTWWPGVRRGSWLSQSSV